MKVTKLISLDIAVGPRTNASMTPDGTPSLVHVQYDAPPLKSNGVMFHKLGTPIDWRRVSFNAMSFESAMERVKRSFYDGFPLDKCVLHVRAMYQCWDTKEKCKFTTMASESMHPHAFDFQLADTLRLGREVEIQGQQLSFKMESSAVE